MNADGSFSASTWVTGLMFLGGLVMGPGYYIYCEGFSGKKAGEYAMQAQGSSYVPVSLRLDPGMNPVAIDISAYASSRGGAIGMAIDDGRTRLFQGAASFTSEGSSTQSLDRFSVPRADTYTVRFSGNPAGLSTGLSNVQLKVRRNVKVPDMKVVWWGVGIMVAGFVIGIFTGDVVGVKPGRSD